MQSGSLKGDYVQLRIFSFASQNAFFSSSVCCTSVILFTTFFFFFFSFLALNELLHVAEELVAERD